MIAGNQDCLRHLAKLSWKAILFEDCEHALNDFGIHVKRSDDLIAHLRVQSAELCGFLLKVFQLLVGRYVYEVEDLTLVVV